MNCKTNHSIILSVTCHSLQNFPPLIHSPSYPFVNFQNTISGVGHEGVGWVIQGWGCLRWGWSRWGGVGHEGVNGSYRGRVGCIMH